MANQTEQQAADSLKFNLRQLVEACKETESAVSQGMQSGDFTHAVSTFPQIRSYLGAASSLIDQIEQQEQAWRGQSGSSGSSGNPSSKGTKSNYPSSTSG